MKYLPQSKLATYRSSIREDYCPLTELLNVNPVLDHDHATGLVRGAIEGNANVWIGRVEHAYMRLPVHIKRNVSIVEFLRNTADYLESNHSHKKEVLHPQGLRDNVKRFKSLTKGAQEAILEEQIKRGLIEDIDLSSLKNKKQRGELFAKSLKRNKI